MRVWVAAGCLAVAVHAAAPASAQDYSAEQERYCTGDAFRLCGQYIPDVARITACMTARKAELSPGCRAVFGPPRPAGGPPVARGPEMRERPYTPGARPPYSPGPPRPPVFDDYDD